ncbi:MAG: superoxide dismutase family protein [Caulobacteraceae bacterium]
MSNLIVIAALAAAAANATAGASAVITMQGASGLSGTATLSQGARGLSIKLDLRGLAPGPHGIHLHQVGDCSDPKFTSAGAHINPAKVQHGLDNPHGPEAGDLSNIVADKSGRVRTTISTSRVTLGALLDADGSALVVHESADDQKTQPIGGSGARIACGTIR